MPNGIYHQQIGHKGCAKHHKANAPPNGERQLLKVHCHQLWKGEGHGDHKPNEKQPFEQVNGAVFFAQGFYIDHIKAISTGIDDKQKVAQTDVGGIGSGLLAKQNQRQCAQKSHEYANGSFGAYVFFEE